jgi:hypothetical protein
MGRCSRHKDADRREGARRVGANVPILLALKIEAL